jgi:hypothetical protein
VGGGGAAGFGGVAFAGAGFGAGAAGDGAVVSAILSPSYLTTLKAFPKVYKMPRTINTNNLLTQYT